MNMKTFTLRIPENLFEEVAKRKRKTTAEYVLEPVAEKVSRDREAELIRGFESLVADEDDSEASAWMGAQTEAMGRIDG